MPNCKSHQEIEAFLHVHVRYFNLETRRGLVTLLALLMKLMSCHRIDIAQNFSQMPQDNKLRIDQTETKLKIDQEELSNTNIPGSLNPALPMLEEWNFCVKNSWHKLL